MSENIPSEGEKMPANLPHEMQVEIMKRAPVKSLLRFRSLSKQWKSKISSTKFITDHKINQHHHILIVRHLDSNNEVKFALLDDNNNITSFPQPKFSPTVNLDIGHMIGSSHGLVCVYGFDKLLNESLVVVWNPSIRRSVSVAAPSRVFSIFGFGVCPKTTEPKIVKIAGTTSRDQKAEVFGLTSGVWKSVLMNVIPCNSHFAYISNQVLIDGAIYWVVVVVAKNKSTSVQILSFDLTSEEFRLGVVPDDVDRQVRLPINFALPNLCLSKIEESLVVLNYRTDDAGKRVCDVWKMLENGVPNLSFAKLFTVKVDGSDGLAFYFITGFSKTGQPIMEQRYRLDDPDYTVTELEVYDVSSKHINGLGIHGWMFETTTYTESLLLLDHPGSITTQ